MNSVFQSYNIPNIYLYKRFYTQIKLHTNIQLTQPKIIHIYIYRLYIKYIIKYQTKNEPAPYKYTNSNKSLIVPYTYITHNNTNKYMCIIIGLVFHLDTYSQYLHLYKRLYT